jgi:hypothetical protein
MTLICKSKKPLTTKDTKGHKEARSGGPVIARDRVNGKHPPRRHGDTEKSQKVWAWILRRAAWDIAMIVLGHPSTC